MGPWATWPLRSTSRTRASTSGPKAGWLTRIMAAGPTGASEPAPEVEERPGHAQPVLDGRTVDPWRGRL